MVRGESFHYLVSVFRFLLFHYGYRTYCFNVNISYTSMPCICASPHSSFWVKYSVSRIFHPYAGQGADFDCDITV